MNSCDPSWAKIWSGDSALSAPPAGIVLYRTLSVINAVLEHTNIKVPHCLDTAINWFWVSPNMHKLHDSRVRTETDSNYSNLFSLSERLFRTFTPSARAVAVRYGINGYDGPETQKFFGLLALPFRQEQITGDSSKHELTV